MDMSIYIKREMNVKSLLRQFLDCRSAARETRASSDEARQAEEMVEDAAKAFLAEFFGLLRDFGFLVRAEQFAQEVKPDVHDALWAIGLGIEE